MILISKENVLVAIFDNENDTHWINTKKNCYYQKTNLGLSVTDIPLPNEAWALPQQAKLVDGVWVQNPDYIEVEV